jgi:kynurenine formamidase
VIVDLSVVVDATTQGPPAAGSPPVLLETAFRGPGHWQSSRMAALLHTGTHVDAPLHVVEGGRPIHDVTLDELAGTAVVLDLSDAGEREVIDGARLSRAAEALSHAPTPGEIVVVRTDWTDRWWGTFPDYYTRSPFLTEEAGAWLAAMHPRAVVVDFFEEECAVSTEFSSEDFVVHRAILGADVPLIEQATRIGTVRAERFEIRAAMVSLAGVEASPCRLFAEAG